MECITVRPTDALRGVRRERRARRRGCYLLEDRYGTYLVAAQKLQPIAHFIQTVDPTSRVSLTALYEILDTSDNRVGGYAKHRWRLRFVPLDEAVARFEAERGRFERALIVGQPECYAIESRAPELSGAPDRPERAAHRTPARPASLSGTVPV